MFVNLIDYGYSGASVPGVSAIGDGVIPARITEMRRDLYKAICQYGEVTAVITGTFLYEAQYQHDYPAVGDFVLLKYNANGPSGITEVLPRISKFSRADFSGHEEGYVKNIVEQVVAANFDYVFILCSLNFNFNPSRIARYITASRRSGGAPVVLLTKADLCADLERVSRVETIQRIAPDIPVLSVSCVTGLGLDALTAYLPPAKTIVLLGSSGVGKSSLLNTLAGEKIMEVKAIREEDSKGRHTTSHRQMVRLPGGALVIDTPGMRELGLWDADQGVNALFSNIEELALQCRFSDCTHKSEPGCAVKAALDNGSLSEEQWKHYLTHKKESAFVESKSAFLQHKKEWQKQITRFNRKKHAGQQADDERDNKELSKS
ncbi:MAG: ribosome small subunit-dependent GTPase A [Treponema sp.]|jgi:ribosome biogenesis GTPase|nr:ribosome small subunit-dependent GTPase A [Treponema sp.]